jgi:hypothetical protein
MSVGLDFRRPYRANARHLGTAVTAAWLAIFILVPACSFAVTLRLLDKAGFAPWRWSPQIERRVNYQDGAAGTMWLGAGWGTPESRGVWTVGERSFITIPFDPRTRRAELLIKTAGFLVPRRRLSQTVLVLVNGRQVATWQYRFGEPAEQYREIDIEVEDLKSGSAQIEFVNRNPESPKEYVIFSNDDRRLAMRLGYLLVREYFTP